MCALTAHLSIHHMCTSALGCQQRVSDHMVLELQTALGYRVCVLGIESTSSGKAPGALNHWDLSYFVWVRSPYIAQASLQLCILLHQAPKWWDCGCVPPHPASQPCWWDNYKYWAECREKNDEFRGGRKKKEWWVSLLSLRGEGSSGRFNNFYANLQLVNIYSSFS